MKQLLIDQDVEYPIPITTPAYPLEADLIKFQFGKWRAHALVAPYKACILGGSESDNQAIKHLLDRSFGGELHLGYSSFLLQVLTSKLDAFGRMGMEDQASPCRILSTTTLGRGTWGEATIAGEFGEFLHHCSTTLSTEVMAGWFYSEGKVSTYSYTFANRSLRVYSGGPVVGSLFLGHVQILSNSFTNLLDLPEFDIDVELLHFVSPVSIPE